MVRVSVVLTDKLNQPIPGVGGPLQGVTGLSYTPEGCVLDGIGYVRFKIPLTVRRNTKVVVGTRVQVFENQTRAAWAIITAKSETISEDGIYAQFDCPDLLFLLHKLTVTSGYMSAPGESLATTLLRLLGLDTRETWLSYSDLFDPKTGITAYDGIPFSVQGGSIADALMKLGGERFSHAKRGLGMSIEFGAMGTTAYFGGGTAPARLVGLTGAAYVPDSPVRLIDLASFKHVENGEVINDTVPANGDSGIAKLTLRTLYNYTGETARLGPDGKPDGSYQSGPVAFTGYNPLYPICRRTAQSGATFDGMDYFIQDTASVAAYDLYMDTNPQPANIAPVKNAAGGVSPADITLAAVALYQYALSRILWSAKPQKTITGLQTVGYADVRDLAGRNIHVYITRQMPDGTPIVSVDMTPMVLKIEVAWDDTTGDPKYTWDLSTNGKQAASFANLVLGRIAQLDQAGYTTDIIPVPINFRKPQNIGPGADLVLNWRARNNLASIHYVFGFLTLEGMVHTRDDQGHTQDVVTGATPHDVNAVPHDTNALQLHFNVGGVAQEGALDYDPAVTLTLASGSAPGGAVSLVTDGTSIWAAGHSGAAIRQTAFTSQHLGVTQAQTNASSGGRGGKLQATTGAQTGTGQTGGTVPKASHLASQGFGAKKTVATIESVYRGPLPTGVTLWIDGVKRFGPFDTTPAPLDLTQWVDGNAHEFRVKSPTNGAAELEIDALVDLTTLAAVH